MSDAPSSVTPRQALASLLVVVLLLGAGVGGFALLRSLRGEPERTPQVPKAVAVRAIEPHFGPFREEISGYGKTRALRRSSVPAQNSAVVEFVAPNLEAGLAVDTSTVLVRLQSEDFETEVKARTAQLERDRSALAAARLRKLSLDDRVQSMKEEVAAGERDYETTRDLQDQKLSTRREVDVQRQLLERMRQRLSEISMQADESDEAIHQAVQDVEKATQGLAKADADLARCEIRAPYAGIVVSRSVQVGAWVTPGTEVFEILDPGRVEVPISLAAQRLGDVSVGAVVRLYERRGGPLLAEATVARIDPAVDDAERSFFVYAELGSPEHPTTVAVGRFVYAVVDGPRHERVFAVPRVAFVDDQVFVAAPTADGAVARRRRPVVIRWLPELALIVSGVEEGEAILVSNLEEVADGTPVQVTTEGETGIGS